MLQTRNMKSQAKGFTLTEAAIVLGIVGLILGAIWVAAASVYNNLRVSKTSEQLLTIVQAIRSMHATQSTVDAAITAADIARAGGVPSDMVSTVGGVATVRDVWGGEVVIDDWTFSVAQDSFSISFASVPESACIDLLVRNTGTGRDTGLIGAGDAAQNNSATFPVTVSEAGALCEAGNANTIVFTFRLKA